MATSIFTPCEGAIVRINLCGTGGGGQSSTFNISIGGNRINFPTTGFILEMQGNYQFLHALDRFIYYYSFGDRVGEMTVSGMGFVGKVCTPGMGYAAHDGICSLYDLYASNKQSKIRSALNITAGTCDAFKAFLTGMRIEVSSGQGGVPIGQWSLRFHVIPPRDT